MQGELHTLPGPPPSLSDAHEREERKQRLAAAYRLFGRLGFGEGVAGHITARDPISPDQFWVGPWGKSFARMTASSLLLVAADGNVVAGEGPLNRAAFSIHSEIHRARPDVVAAAHAHSPWGVLWSTVGEGIEALTQDACAFYEDHAVYPEYTGIPLDLEMGKRIAATLGDYKALILQNHGLITVGQSVDEAAWWFVAFERACQVQARSRMLRGEAPLPRIPHETAIETRALVGNSEFGWFGFQPYWEELTTEEPELLD